MPDRTDLDERLAGGRTALLAGIEQPPLERIGARAAGIRRRRRARGAAAAVAVIALAGILVRPEGAPPDRQAAAPPPGVPVYAAQGVTIDGLPDPSEALDLPGTVVDVEFTDADHGYAVTACEQSDGGCRPGFAATADGGLSWTPGRLPDALGADAVPDLLAFERGRLVVRAGATTYTSPNGGRRWYEAPPNRLTAAKGGAEQVLAAGGAGPGCVGGRVEVWSGELGRLRLYHQPELAVCQVTRGATTGSWWAGGVAGDQAGVAVTRDGGATWLRTPLPAAGAARVAVAGPHVYALVTDPDGQLVAVFHSADRGAAFDRVDRVGGPSLTVSGDVVPLLDGRILVAGADGGWWLSADDGATFRRADGTLPVVGRLARTSAGYLAYGLFGAGWTAFSPDGARWLKLHLR